MIFQDIFFLKSSFKTKNVHFKWLQPKLTKIYFSEFFLYTFIYTQKYSILITSNKLTSEKYSLGAVRFQPAFYFLINFRSLLLVFNFFQVAGGPLFYLTFLLQNICACKTLIGKKRIKNLFIVMKEKNLSRQAIKPKELVYKSKMLIFILF